MKRINEELYKNLGNLKGMSFKIKIQHNLVVTFDESKEKRYE